MRDTEDTHYITEHLQVTPSVLWKKYFINKIVKNPLRKEQKNGNTLQEKQPQRQNKNLISIYMKSSYPFTIQKWLVSVIQFLETMQSQ